MLGFINTVVCIMHTLNSRERLVEFGFLDVPCVDSVTVDILEGRCRVYADCVWGPADNRTVFLVQPVEKEVPVAFVGMPCCNEGGEFAEEGAGVLGEGVQEDPVEEKGEEGYEGDGGEVGEACEEGGCRGEAQWRGEEAPEMGAGEGGDGRGEVIHCGVRKVVVSAATEATVRSPEEVIVVVDAVVMTETSPN